MARSVGVLLLVTILSAAGVAYGHPSTLEIDWVTYQGSGCNYGNTNWQFYNNWKGVTFLFGGMTATSDSGLAGSRKSCGIIFQMKYPKGWSFSLAKVTGRGYAKLDAGVVGIYETSHFISGQEGTAYATRKALGPMDENFELTDWFETELWTKCGTSPNINVNVVVQVKAPKGKDGLVTVSSTDHKFILLYHMKWRRC